MYIRYESRKVHAEIRTRVRERGKEDQDIGANKVLKKVRDKSKKIRNSPTKHGHSHYHGSCKEYDEQEPEWHSEPVYKRAI
ncbi:hypothetical protein Bca52824_068876 [Brassica carinata]|uniref:LTI65/LTI78 N-terminal domain-containing protein n=1 Tax=Brassica carinata TaxID=52824 RepID=A0A8X7U0W9_BRACI|nr:hypothetical protein Bca52824_068876 [Brassica carinata]